MSTTKAVKYQICARCVMGTTDPDTDMDWEEFKDLQ